MLEEQPLTLEHPYVQAAKEKWNKQARYGTRKLKLSFDELFEYFKADCIRHAAIADLAGVSRERIRQIYDRHFRVLFGDKNGMQRMHACTLETRLVRIEKSRGEFLQDAVIKDVSERAQDAGCKIEPELLETYAKFSGRTILANGYRCSLRCLTHKFQPPGARRAYSPTSVSWSELKQYFATIFHVAVSGFDTLIFIVPSTVFKKVIFGDRRKTGSPNIYLPLEKLPPYNDIKPRIDYWQYEDAWHLLPPKQDPPS